VQAYFEELWRRLPADARPSDFELRRRYLLAVVARGERVLDVGCGAGEFSAKLARAGAHVVGIEVAPTALDRARTNHPDLDFRLVELDQPLPFDDNSFHVVWAGEVIEHVADTARWLSELRRVLAPGGRLLLSTPNHGRVLLALRGIEHFSDPLGDHLHLYTRRSLRQLLEEFGFGELEVRAVAGFPLLRRTLLSRGVR
jgi:2-polyprenyl-3-methyl-5-hydroxy-6-metoxy-1,4-benzoquinol methylase